MLLFCIDEAWTGLLLEKMKHLLIFVTNYKYECCDGIQYFEKQWCHQQAQCLNIKTWFTKHVLYPIPTILAKQILKILLVLVIMLRIDYCIKNWHFQSIIYHKQKIWRHLNVSLRKIDLAKSRITIFFVSIICTLTFIKRIWDILSDAERNNFTLRKNNIKNNIVNTVFFINFI